MVPVILDDDLKAVESLVMFKDQVFYTYASSEGIGDVLLVVVTILPVFYDLIPI
jgi:hypothetical protein